MSNIIKYNARFKGAAAEHIAAAALLINDYRVYEYMVNDGNADLIAEKDNTIYKIQVKAMFVKDGYLIADLRKSKSNNDRNYNKNEIDIILIVDITTGEVFWMDVIKCNGITAISKSKLIECAIKLFPL